MSPDPKARSSVLGRLLEELSWSGKLIRHYRDGGQGFENVLTAEVLTALDFLPRSAFLGAVLSAAHGADGARAQVAAEIEDAELTLLPDELQLPSAAGQRSMLIVQPDGLMVSPSCVVLLEAKRIRRSSFQVEQLAREYVALMCEAAGRTPLMLLILGEPPPVAVKGRGRVSIADAVSAPLSSVLDRTENDQLTAASLIDQLPEVAAWITWAELDSVVQAQRATFQAVDPSVASSIGRLTAAVSEAISRHA